MYNVFSSIYEMNKNAHLSDEDLYNHLCSKFEYSEDFLNQAKVLKESIERYISLGRFEPSIHKDFDAKNDESMEQGNNAKNDAGMASSNNARNDADAVINRILSSDEHYNVNEPGKEGKEGKKFIYPSMDLNRIFHALRNIVSKEDTTSICRWLYAVAIGENMIENINSFINRKIIYDFYVKFSKDNNFTIAGKHSFLRVIRCFNFINNDVLNMKYTTVTKDDNNTITTANVIKFSFSSFQEAVSGTFNVDLYSVIGTFIDNYSVYSKHSSRYFAVAELDMSNIKNRF